MDSRDHPTEWITHAEELNAEGREEIVDILNTLAARIDDGNIPFHLIYAEIQKVALEAMKLAVKYQKDIDEATGDAYDYAEGE